MNLSPPAAAVLALALALSTPARSQPAAADSLRIAAAADRATGGRVVRELIDAPSLRGNLLGDPAERDVLIYLPPGYDADDARRYPVVYLLHGYGAGPSSWLGEDGYEEMDLRVVLDGLIGRGAIAPLIVVMPDARTQLGGSWYADSPTSGNWERFVADDLVAFVDQRYRTRPGREQRGIAGQSMGGYGTMRLALHRPDVFGAALVMSPVNLVNPDPFGTPAQAAALSVTDPAQQDAPLLGLLMWSKAVAFSPDADAGPFHADLPFERTDGGIARRESVWRRWLDACLIPEVPTRAGALREVRLRLEVGTRDPARRETAALAEALTAEGVPFAMAVFDGGHVAGVRARFEGPVFRFFDEAFADSPAGG